MKVEEGSPETGDNTRGAHAMAELAAYHARKRLISTRTLLFTFSVAVLLAVRGAHVLAFDLALGGVAGVINMLLIMRANERLLDGRTTLKTHIARGIVRIFACGVLPALVLTLKPWWGFGVYFAGFFAPLVLYAFELRRTYQQGVQ